MLSRYNLDVCIQRRWRRESSYNKRSLVLSWMEKTNCTSSSSSVFASSSRSGGRGDSMDAKSNRGERSSGRGRGDGDGDEINDVAKLFQGMDLKNNRGERSRGRGRGRGDGDGDGDKIDALGRLLTRILRHMASELHLNMRTDGFVKVQDLLQLNMKTFANIPLRSHTADDIREAVRRDNKQRFCLVEENGELLIRANQGHTVKTVESESLLKPILSAEEVPVCVHGTYKKNLESILKTGLKRMARLHVHFSSGLARDGQVNSGMRRDANVLIFLNAKKALEDGLKMYISDKTLSSEGASELMQLSVSANSNHPWNSTLPTLHLLRKCRTQNHVNQFHARIITSGFISSTSLTTKIVLNFISSPHLSLVRFARYIFFSRHALLDHRQLEDPFLWNAVMKSYSHGSEPARAVTLFWAMVENGVSVDRFSFSLVLKACSRLGLVREGLQIHGLLRKIELRSDLFLQNCLISWYLKCGCLELAHRVFTRMEKLDSVSYNSMIDGYVKLGMIDSARLLFDSMPEKEKNLNSWNTMICGYAQSEDRLEVARKLFDEMPQRDLVSWNSMIDGCVKCGKMKDAQQLFDRMPKRDAVTWASMIDGYAKSGNIEIASAMFNQMSDRDVIACNAMMAGYLQNGLSMEALSIFHYMKGEYNLNPDHTTLSIVLSAIAQLGNLDEGIEIHGFIEENMVFLGGKVGVSLIDMYSKCGSVDNAMLVFENIKEKNVDHWNAMIGGLAVHGLGELALNMFMEMKKIHVEPDDITFIGVLSGCAHAGLVKEGIICFEIMRRVYKLKPKLQHYGCIVDILGRAGRVEEAWRFIGKMPIEANDVIWRTLLSACNNHRNLSIGETVARRLMSVDSSNSSSYVLLSNMYASMGMWREVNMVRKMMKERKVKKIPGCSWIELEGMVHEFFVQDQCHPQVAQICSLLDKMSSGIQT